MAVMFHCQGYTRQKKEIKRNNKNPKSERSKRQYQVERHMLQISDSGERIIREESQES